MKILKVLRSLKWKSDTSQLASSLYKLSVLLFFVPSRLNLDRRKIEFSSIEIEANEHLSAWCIEKSQKPPRRERKQVKIPRISGFIAWCGKVLAIFAIDWLALVWLDCHPSPQSHRLIKQSTNNSRGEFYPQQADIRSLSVSGGKS